MGKIRIAFVNDIRKIIEVSDATWKQTYAPILSTEQIDFMYERMYTPEALMQQMQGGATFLLYTEDERVCGFASYEFRDEGIYIPKIYVLPDMQRKRVGQSLIDYIEKVALKNNCAFLELNVNRKNSAMYFYKKIGFELFEKADIAYGKFWLNDYVLRKKIG